MAGASTCCSGSTSSCSRRPSWGRGAVGTSYNFAAPTYNRLLAAVRANDLATARAEQYRGVELIALILRHGFLPAAKELMRVRGVDLGPVRLPHVPFTGEQVVHFRRDLAALGFPEGERGA